MSGWTGRENFKQAPCRHCGKCTPAHRKIKVFPDDGPPGSWHWQLWCADGKRRYST